LEEMLPVIEANSNAIAITREPFITFTISAMTKITVHGGQGSGPSAVLAAAPAPVARNTTLLTHTQILLHSHLTGLGRIWHPSSWTCGQSLLLMIRGVFQPLYQYTYIGRVAGYRLLMMVTLKLLFVPTTSARSVRPRKSRQWSLCWARTI
jgi:hypothetical protein